MFRSRVQKNKMKLLLAALLIMLLRKTAYVSAWISLLPMMIKGSAKEQEDTRWMDARNL
ncbi:hypothetical protein [Paenibacillus rigui]|uniref:hypothetical protein n=1 Tax=Paenibacillus rigui TaxID=554312 RepID=UPI0015C6453B|nr:hypothetical protein [Paenibacillus rigui]